VDYRIEYSPDAEQHLRGLTAQQRTTVLVKVEEQLSHEPTVETRKRRRMRDNPVAPWELRIGGIRVYYDIEEDPAPKVLIRAVGLKRRSRLRIGREVFRL
jgi:mRNA-degrading endonuclease RelE of RelBE toxin-antitoxin system